MDNWNEGGTGENWPISMKATKKKNMKKMKMTIMVAVVVMIFLSSKLLTNSIEKIYNEYKIVQ